MYKFEFKNEKDIIKSLYEFDKKIEKERINLKSIRAVMLLYIKNNKIVGRITENYSHPFYKIKKTPIRIYVIDHKFNPNRESYYLKTIKYLVDIQIKRIFELFKKNKSIENDYFRSNRLRMNIIDRKENDIKEGKFKFVEKDSLLRCVNLFNKLVSEYKNSNLLDNIIRYSYIDFTVDDNYNLNCTLVIRFKFDQENYTEKLFRSYLLLKNRNRPINQNLYEAIIKNTIYNAYTSMDNNRSLIHYYIKNYLNLEGEKECLKK